MRRQPIQRLATAAVLFAAVAVVLATPAAASTINTSTKVRACTNLSDGSCLVTYGTLSATTTVSMRCWRLDSTYAGTDKWFWVAGGGLEGFVSANYVSNQWTSSPSCSTLPAIQAARWAGTKLSESAYANLCLQFVHDAWAYAGKTVTGTPSTSALSYWNTNPNHYTKYTSGTPPVGAMVFWNKDSHNALGHVALSIGGGLTISTLERSTSTIHVMSIADRNKTKPYLGYMKMPGT